MAALGPDRDSPREPYAVFKIDAAGHRIMNSTPEADRFQYAFGEYTFDPRNGELNDGQKTAQLRPQVAKLLELLLRNAGDTVSREDIKNHLWGGNVVVEFEEGISACVRQLRIALNDGAAGSRYIQTISRRGYKFVFPVSIQASGNGHDKRHMSAPLQAAAPTLVRRRHGLLYYVTLGLALAALLLVAGAEIYRNRLDRFFAGSEDNGRTVVAVLPFNNLSQNPDTTMLGAALANEVLNLLGPMAPNRLSVIASTSSAHFTKSGTIRDIGQELGASYVLEGSVTQPGHTFHVSARLIRVADQSYVWGDEYDLDANYSASTYERLVIRIATQVATLLAPNAAAKPLAFTNNRDAASIYQLGRYQITQGDGRKSYSDCQKAMTLDPRFAAAYACTARAMLGNPVVTPAQLTAAKDLVATALNLDSGSAEAHMLKGELDMFYSWDLAGAGTEFKTALRYDPGDAWTWQMYAEYLSAMDQENGMQNAMDTARALDPVSVSVTNDFALVSFIARQYEKAESNARVNANLNSGDELAQHILILSLLGEGKYAEAAKQAAAEMQAQQASAQDVAAVRSNSRSSLVNYFTWYAQQLAAKPANKYSAVFLADAYMHLGKPDQAFDTLHVAVTQHAVSTLIPFISVWPSLRPLCVNPAYLAMTQQLGQVGCLPQ